MRLVAVLAMFLGLVVSSSQTRAGERLQGKVRVDGSSTVFPISEAVAEEFGSAQPKVRVTIGVSGTGGGFKKFLAGETDINDASRPIKDKELAQAQANGIQFIEMPVAYDGLSVVIHKDNDWVDYLTVAELKKIWEPGSTVVTWQDVRPEWPAEKIGLYGPGTDSGTFDYFTEAINGKAQACRSDFTASEDDNVLVTGVAGDKYSLGFFGFAYYVENQDKLRVVPIDDGKGAIAPSVETINNGSYAPLSRPIFIYVSTAAAERPEVQAFVAFYLETAGTLANEVGYVGLPANIYALSTKRFDQRITGSVYTGVDDTAGISLEKLYSIQ
jgi:phosphate transport system substrate-binding protein